LEYNFRLSCNQGIKFGQLNPEFSGFYDFQLLEEINHITNSLGLIPVFSDVPSISSFKDTGERFGLRANVLEGVPETKELIPFYTTDGNDDCVTSFLSYADLLDKDPAMPVRKAKFAATWMKYKEPKDKINFAQMTIDWNVDFYLMKSGQKESAQIRPKSIQDLQRYHRQTMERENTYQTMASHQDETRHLRAAHRRTKTLDGSFSAEATIPEKARSTTPNVALQPPETEPVHVPIAKGNRKRCKECGHDWKSPLMAPYHKTLTGVEKGKKQCTVSPASKRNAEASSAGRCNFTSGNGKKMKKCTVTDLHWHTACAEACCST
jgi:hypothetical protein